MKHKVAELEGALLDAAVAKAEGCTDLETGGGWRSSEGSPLHTFFPSFQWRHGGPIIDRERIGLDAGDAVTDWTAHAPMHVKLGIASQDGPTALIAAMRAFVASRLGEEIEL